MLLEESYRLIVETASEGIWAIDEQGLTTFVNPALEEMLGWGPGEMLGEPALRFVEPESLEEAQRSLRACEEGIGQRVELPLLTTAGRTVWALVLANPLHGPCGEYAGALGMLTNITAARAHAGEGSHLAAIVRSSADSIIGMSTSGVIESWNEASSRLYGHTAEEAVGRNGPQLLSRDPVKSAARVARAAAGEDQRQVASEDVSSDGSLLEVSLTISPIRDAHGVVVGVSRFARDISWRKRLEGEMRHMNEHDWLTDLQNRRRLIVELDRCLAYAARYERAGAVLVLDVDNFKLVNDSEGHAAGDMMLKHIAEVLIDCTGDADLIARLGGDEFAIVMPDGGERRALALAADVRAKLAVQTEGAISLSVGICLFTPQRKLTADDILAAADVAQYEASEHGGDQACIYQGRSAETLNWFERIRTALAEDRFLLYGQPIVDLRTGLVAYHELLIRMLAEDGSIIGPGEFLPTAERFGLITEIDRWVTEHGLRMAVRGLPVTINLAGSSIGDAQVLGLVHEAVVRGLHPPNVIFEITETAAVSRLAKADTFARTLVEIGCELALDDFGTGFGSFTDLKHLGARFVKIDMEFVRDIVSNDTDQKVVTSIVDIAHSLGKQTVAEGVEDAATVTALKMRGVDYAQGFHLGRPQLMVPGAPVALGA